MGSPAPDPALHAHDHEPDHDPRAEAGKEADQGGGEPFNNGFEHE